MKWLEENELIVQRRGKTNNWNLKRKSKVRNSLREKYQSDKLELKGKIFLWEKIVILMKINSEEDKIVRE